MTFRPAMIPTIFAAIAFAILMGLGNWQLGRHFKKQELLGEVRERLAEAPVQNADLDIPIERLAWRKAELKGHFLGQPPFLGSGRFEFGRPGFDLYEGFVPDGHEAILVNRGWVPSENWKENLAKVATNAETVTIRGLVVDPVDFGNPDAEPIPANADLPERWPRFSENTLLSRLPPGSKRMVVVAGEEISRPTDKRIEPLPVTGYLPRPKEIPHFEYAMQWFLIGATLIGVWGYAGYRRGKALTEAAKAPAAAP